jgi:SAM-dependent methyltransferase
MENSNAVDHEVEIISQPEKVDMADDWYQYAQLDHFWIKSRFRAICTHLAGHTIGKKIFEIGCGHGVVIKQFEDTFNTIVDGCDLNMIALSQISGTKGKIYCLDIYDKPQQLVKSYDGILLLDVIEHIDDHVDFLKTSIEYLKEDALVIVNVPALNSLFSRYDIAAGHKRRYTKKMMRKLFIDCGITDVQTHYWGFSMLPIAVVRKIVLIFVSKEKIISTGFKTPNSFSNNALNWLLKIGIKIMSSPPLGTSLIGIGRIKMSSKTE